MLFCFGDPLVVQASQPLPWIGPQVTPENFESVADRFEELPLHFLRFHGSSEVDEVPSSRSHSSMVVTRRVLTWVGWQVLDAMDYAVYAHDVEHIILDNLQFMLSGQGRFGSQ